MTSSERYAALIFPHPRLHHIHTHIKTHRSTDREREWRKALPSPFVCFAATAAVAPAYTSNLGHVQGRKPPKMRKISVPERTALKKIQNKPLAQWLLNFTATCLRRHFDQQSSRRAEQNSTQELVRHSKHIYMTEFRG